MRSTLLAIVAGLLVGCATTPDPIDHLVTSLSSQMGFWKNGSVPYHHLPSTATPEEVVRRAFEVRGFDKTQVASYKILKIRQVHIQNCLPDMFTAALVQTSDGEKIVLFDYEASEWWSRIYDIKPSA